MEQEVKNINPSRYPSVFTISTLLESCFQFLTLRELVLTIRLCCKEWNKHTYSPFVWKYQDPLVYHVDKLLILQEKCPFLKHISFYLTDYNLIRRENQNSHFTFTNPFKEIKEIDIFFQSDPFINNNLHFCLGEKVEKARISSFAIQNSFSLVNISQNWKYIKSLSLDCLQITSLLPLIQLKETLVELHLIKIEVKDDTDLKPVTELTNLEYLEIRSCYINYEPFSTWEENEIKVRNECKENEFEETFPAYKLVHLKTLKLVGVSICIGCAFIYTSPPSSLQEKKVMKLEKVILQMIFMKNHIFDDYCFDFLSSPTFSGISHLVIEDAPQVQCIHSGFLTNFKSLISLDLSKGLFYPLVGKEKETIQHFTTFLKQNSYSLKELQFSKREYLFPLISSFCQVLEKLIIRSSLIPLNYSPLSVHNCLSYLHGLPSSLKIVGFVNCTNVQTYIPFLRAWKEKKKNLKEIFIEEKEEERRRKTKTILI